MTDATTASCAKAFLNGWISRFGLPDRVTSDRGAQFTSELWQYFSQSLGIDLHHTCAYRPQHNGALERIHRTAKQILIARLEGHAHNWHTQLPWTLLAMRTTPKEPTGASAAEMTYGSTLLIPGEFFPSRPMKMSADNMDAIRASVSELIPAPLHTLTLPSTCQTA